MCFQIAPFSPLIKAVGLNLDESDSTLDLSGPADTPMNSTGLKEKPQPESLVEKLSGKSFLPTRLIKIQPKISAYTEYEFNLCFRDRGGLDRRSCEHHNRR